MKFIKLPVYLTTLLGLVIFNSSCKKNLEEHPYSTLSSSAVFNNEDGLKKATLGVYQGFTNNAYATWWKFGMAETGHKYAAQPLFSEVFWNDQNKFVGTPTSFVAVEGHDIWVQDYQVIARANTVIANANNAVSATTANTYIAEARFLRGFAYFDLVRTFGGVPIVDKEITSLSQNDLISGKRASVKATYDFLVSDMEFAAANLPDKWTGADAGRISAATAKGMLGKVYLTMAGKPLVLAGYFQKAVDVLKQIVGSANESKYGLALLPNFSDPFSITNKKNAEILLAFSYAYSPNNPNGNINPFYSFPRGLTNGDEQTFYGLSYSFYQLFENSDKRRDFTVVSRYKTSYSGDGGTIGDSIIYNPRRLKYIDTNTHQVFGFAIINQGLAFGKYDRTFRPASAGGGAVYSTDLIYLRFSDVLLCLAEAEIETGDLSGAQKLINRVRIRAGATPYTDVSNMQARVRLERRLELTGEYTTVFDIRRWGTLDSEIAAMVPTQVADGIVGTYNTKFELYPIPQVEINANPNLTQNPGY